MEDKNIKQETEYKDVPQVFAHDEPDLPALEDGKCYRRISDGLLRFGSVLLGKEYFLGGKKLKKPITEKKEDYEVIDIPNEYKFPE